MKVSNTAITGLILIEPSVLNDDRGFFLENHKESALKSVLGRPHKFAQSNHSRSKANTLRGFRKESCDKLIYVVRGTALCVVVDTRPESETFGEHMSFMMGDEPGNRNRIFVSEGLSNAFYCITDADYFNDVSEEYEDTVRLGFRWNDPSVGVNWPCETPFLSEKDKSLPFLRELFPEHPKLRKV